MNLAFKPPRGPAVYRSATVGQLTCAPASSGTQSVLPPPVYRPYPPPGGGSFIQRKAPHAAPPYQVRQMPNVNGRQQIRVVAPGGDVAGSVDLESLGTGGARLSNLVISEPHRNQGLGTRLVHSALQAARSRGIASVQLEARPASASVPANALFSLYGKAGFRTIARTASGTPIMQAGRSDLRPPSPILRRSAPLPPPMVVQRAWNKKLYESTASTKTLTDDDFPGLTQSAPKSAPIAISAPTEFAKWVAKPVEAIENEPEDDLAGLKSKILSWDRKSHEGVKAKLTETQINELTQWAKSVLSKSRTSTVFNVLRGEGSGEYTGRDQLKVIFKFGQPLSGGKYPTYHITLKE